MQKVYYRQKFRIRNLYTNKVERLKQDFDKNGKDIWLEGFDSYTEAQKELRRWITITPAYAPFLVIESYSGNTAFVKDIKSQDTHKKLEKLRCFSGKGLAENTFIPRKHENKYVHGKFYTKEINFAQSVERNKGISLIHKLKDKKRTLNQGADFETALKVERLKETTFELGKDIAQSVRERYGIGQFHDRKEIKLWLKGRGYSVKDTRRILHQAFN